MNPSFRFLVHWALRREELCDPGLCPDAPEDDGSGATTARWTGWTPPSARRRDCSSGARST